MENRQKELTGYPSIDRPWLKVYSEEAINASQPTGSIYDFLLAVNKDYPHNIAIHYQNKNITYGELFRKIDCCARAFMALGVQRNDIVTVAMPNTPEMVYTLYALNRLGAIANFIHPLASKDEICNYLNEVKSRFFLMFTGTYLLVGDALKETSVEKAIVVSPVQSLSPLFKWLYRLKTNEKIIEDDRIISWNSFIQHGQNIELPEPQRADNDVAVITHTGGTTGDPKGVMCTNLNYNSHGRQMLADRGSKRQDCTMVHLPPFINYSLSAALASFSSGFRVLLIPRYDPKKMAWYIRRFKVNYILSIPAYFEVLLKSHKIAKDAFNTLGCIVTAGESMSVEMEREVNNVLRAHGSPVNLTKGIGMTELVSGATLTFPWYDADGSSGIPYVKTNCKIVEVGTDDELTYDEIGEICFSGPSVMLGYYGNQAATDEMIHVDADGTRWLHTGDLGYMTRDGIIYVSGRLKRLIMIKDKDGLISKIFPERIEQVIETHPAVALSCIVGVPDKQCIAWPKAFVVLNENIEANQEVKTAILAHCSQHLPPYMVPHNIVFIDEMPRTNRGKIDYKQLEQAQ